MPSEEKETQYATINVFIETKEKFKLAKIAYQNKNKIVDMTDDDFLQLLLKS